MNAVAETTFGGPGAPSIEPICNGNGPDSAAPASRAPAAPSTDARSDAPTNRDHHEVGEPRRASLVEQLVRDPRAFLARIEGRDVPELVRGLLAIVAIGAGIFGAVVGSSRGGRQVLFAAVKLPLLLIGTLVLCAPAFIAVARATGVSISPRGVIALTLGASARFALVLAGLAPVVWLVQGVVDYHGLIMVTVAVCIAAGLAAAGLLFRGLWSAPGDAALRRDGASPEPPAIWAGPLAGLVFVAIYGVVGAHSAWLLRPFVVRPRTVDVPFVRSLEGDLLDAVATSARSSAGIYDRSLEPIRDDRRPDLRRGCEGASCNESRDEQSPDRRPECEGSSCD
jgi:hypothetical protein